MFIEYSFFIYDTLCIDRINAYNAYKRHIGLLHSL